MNIVFDLDGTLSFKGNKIDKRILDCLESVMNKGHQVIFASGRPIRDIMPIIDERFHTIPLIGGNGSIISNNGSVIYKNTIGPNTYSKLLKIKDKHELSILVDDEWDYSIEGDSNHFMFQRVDPDNLANNLPLKKITDPIKVLFFGVTQIDPLVKDLKTLGLSINQYKNEDIIDVTSPGINKFQALSKLDILKNEYICFGNDDNDEVLFLNATYGIQIGRHPIIDLVSDYTIHTDEYINQNIQDYLIEKFEL